MTSTSSPPAPFSFHCVICFETFDPDERYPVVLPCGHTFLCHPCSTRLRRCMECRTSLFHPLQDQQRPGRAKGTPRPSSERIPLPLPRNLLLLTLMEAAERETRAKMVETKTRESIKNFASELDRRHESTPDVSDGASGTDFDDATVWSSITTVSSACGTYAVAAKEGLAITTTQQPEGNNKKQSPALKNENDRNSLHYGDKIQVVHFTDGCATLARNQGVVYANMSQLVKVGGPQDRACQIEGMLFQLSKQIVDYAEKQSELKRIEIGLEKDLKKALLEDFEVAMRPKPDVEISIEANSTTTCIGENVVVSPISRDTKALPAADQLYFSPRSPPPIRSGPRSAAALTRFLPSEELGSGGASKNFGSSSQVSPPLTMKTVSTEYDSADEEHAQTGDGQIFACGSGAMFGLAAWTPEDDEDEESSLIYVPGTIEVGSDAGAELRFVDPEPSSSRIVSSPDLSPRGINFRTGISGHRALGSNKAPPSDKDKGSMRLMSEHKGIGRMRRVRTQTSGGRSPRTIQSLGSWGTTGTIS